MNLNLNYNQNKYHMYYDINRYLNGNNQEVEEHILRYKNRTFKGKNLDEVVEKLKEILSQQRPEAYQMFYGLSTIEQCNYLGKKGCPKTCNLIE